MDILSIQPRAYDYELKHPATGEKLGIVFQIGHNTDPRVIELTTKQAIEYNDRIQGGALETEKMRERQKILSISARILDWKWPEDKTFGPLGTPAFSPEMAEKVCKDARWIWQQLAMQMGETANFFDMPETE